MKETRLEGREEEALGESQGDQVISEPLKRTWSRKFLELAGSAPDFPYPDEPLPAEPGAELGPWNLGLRTGAVSPNQLYPEGAENSGRGFPSGFGKSRAQIEQLVSLSRDGFRTPEREEDQ